MSCVPTPYYFIDFAWQTNDQKTNRPWQIIVGRTFKRTIVFHRVVLLWPDEAAETHDLEVVAAAGFQKKSSARKKSLCMLVSRATT